MSNSENELVRAFLDDTVGSEGFTAHAIADILELSDTRAEAVLRELQREGRVTAQTSGGVGTTQ